MRKATVLILLGASIGVVFVDGFLAQSTVGRHRLQASLLSTSHLNASQDYAYFENISLEYCPGCRWMTKAFWMATELLQSSNPSYRGKIKGVTVIPSQSGTFLISGKAVSMTKDLDGDETTSERIEQLWDRKVDGGFPPVDLIEFEERVAKCLEKVPSASNDASDHESSIDSTLYKTHVIIRYCENSGYLLRAAYYGQELLTTFCDGELDAISIQPITSENDSDGNFSVALLTADKQKDEKSLLLWDKLDSGSFPQVKELKRLVRDVVTPQKDLGHSEASTNSNSNISEEDTSTKRNEDDIGDCIPCNNSETANDMEKEDGEDEDYNDEFLDDDEAEEARRYFGVM